MRDVGGLIPQTAHYIWPGGGSISNDSISNIITFKKNNPMCTINLWVENVDVMKNSLIERGYSSILFNFINIKKIDKFDTETESAIARETADSPLKNYAAASDIIRLAILYKYGGVYMDVDVLMDGPSGEVTSEWVSRNRPPGVLVFRLRGMHGYNYANAMIASEAGAPEMLKMLKYATAPYNGHIFDMGFARTAEKSGVHHLANSARLLGTSLEEVMWAIKRYDKDTRFDVTLTVTGPRVMESFIDASGLSDRMAELKVYSQAIIDKAGKRLNHPGDWELRFNGKSNWAFKVPLHSMKASEV